MPLIPFICAVISFLVVLIITPWIIKYLRKINLVVKDFNKADTPLIPISGGIAVMLGINGGLLVYIFIQTFFYKTSSSVFFILTAITSILLITFIGFIDDLLIRKDQGSSAGLKQWQKPLLTIAAAIPLMVVNAGVSTIAVPFIGEVNLGLIYPLILIPIGVVVAANMINLLGGYNGLETGMGIVYTGMLGAYAYFNGRSIAVIIALVAFASLIAFYRYNKYPAKIFPGDSLTYLLGGVIACIAILGNIEKAAIIASIPFIIEFFLKARSKFKAQSYGIMKNGKIFSRYEKIYSLPHIFARGGRFTEKQITLFLILIELGFSSLIWFV